jgi:hypothetical protein
MSGEGNTFKEFINSFFEKNKKVKSFSWSQYTPYFHQNPKFEVYKDDICINENNSPHLMYDNDIYDAVQEIKNFLKKFENDFFFNEFGDHCVIKVTKYGILINEYCHHE